MAITRLEVGDIVWDSCGKEFGIVITFSPFAYSHAKIQWNHGNITWETISNFSLTGPQNIPSIEVMPF